MAENTRSREDNSQENKATVAREKEDDLIFVLYTDYDSNLDYEEVEEVQVYSEELFFGKVSRMCRQCGETKLYKEFDGNPTDPNILCNSCQEWVDREETLEYLTDDEQAEIEALENAIEEAEEEYEDEWDRQRMIDEVLRELDE